MVHEIRFLEVPSTKLTKTTTTVLVGARSIATFDETDFPTPAGGKQVFKGRFRHKNVS